MPTWIDPSAQKGGSLDLLRPGPAVAEVVARTLRASGPYAPRSDTRSKNRRRERASFGEGRTDRVCIMIGGTKTLIPLDEAGHCLTGAIAQLLRKAQTGAPQEIVVELSIAAQ